MREPTKPMINLDKLTYAGNLQNLASLQGDKRHIFVQGDIGDATLGSWSACTNTAPPYH